MARADRLRRGLLMAVLTVGITAGLAPPATAASPVRAAVAAVDCGGAPLLLQPACYAATAVGGAAGYVGAVAGATVGAAAGQLASGLGDAALSALTGFVVGGAVWFLGQLGAAVTGTTQVQVSSGWFTAHYRTMAGLAAVLAAVFLLLQAATTLVAHDPRRLLRSVAMVAVAGLGTFAAVAVTALMLQVSDELSALVAGSTVGDLHQALTGAARGLGTLMLTSGGPAIPAFATLLAGLIAAAGSVVIWMELLLREVAIYAALLFFPIGLAGLVWDGSRRWARRLTEILGALIFAKFVIVAILSLAAGGLASGRDGYSGVLVGAALLLVAAFSPFLLLRIVGVLEVAAAATALEGVRARGTRPLARGGQGALSAVQRHRSAGAGGGITVAGGGGSGVPAAAGAAGGAGALAAAGVSGVQKAGRQATRTASQTVTAASGGGAPPPKPPTAKGA